MRCLVCVVFVQPLLSCDWTAELKVTLTSPVFSKKCSQFSALATGQKRWTLGQLPPFLKTRCSNSKQRKIYAGLHCGAKLFSTAQTLNSSPQLECLSLSKKSVSGPDHAIRFLKILPAIQLWLAPCSLPFKGIRSQSCFLAHVNGFIHLPLSLSLNRRHIWLVWHFRGTLAPYLDTLTHDFY